MNDRNEGYTVPKMGADSLAKNSKNTPKFIRSICPIGPKVLNTFEKKASSGVCITEYVVQRLQAICPAELSLVSRESLLKTASGKISLAFLIPP